MVSQAVIGQLTLSILITVFIYQLINYDMGGTLLLVYNVRTIRKRYTVARSFLNWTCPTLNKTPQSGSVTFDLLENYNKLIEF